MDRRDRCQNPAVGGAETINNVTYPLICFALTQTSCTYKPYLHSPYPLPTPILILVTGRRSSDVGFRVKNEDAKQDVFFLGGGGTGWAEAASF